MFLRIWTAALAGVLLGSNPGVAGPAAGPDSLLLPLAGTPVITSSFGEYRAGHYHGGLDFSTGGREGLPIRAPESGWVYRLRASGVGYGRSIYFRLDDGRTAVFGHLSAFAPVLQERVEAEQDRLGRYEVDFQPGPGEYRFERGAVLGRTGHSGAGPAHLHAEIRIGESASVAVNPLHEGWTVPDAASPTLTRLRIVPARAGVEVGGGFEPAVVDVPATVPFSITGPVHLWVETSDTASGGAYRLAPYAVDAAVDGEPLVRVAFDRFDWNWPHEVERTYENALARGRGERWIALQAPPRRRQPVTGPPGPGLALERVPGEHVLRVTVSDAAGNHTEAAFPFLVAAPTGGPATGPRIERTRLVSRGSFLELRVAGLPVHRIRIHSAGPGPEAVEPDWTGTDVPGGSLFQLQGEVGTAAGTWTFTVSAGDSTVLAGKALWLGDGSEVLRAKLAGVRLAIDPRAAFESIWITAEDGEAPVAAKRPELEPVSRAVRLEPWMEPLREPQGMTLDPPADEDRRGLALMSREDGTWSFEGADTAGTGLGASVGRLTTLALFRDRTPPRITWTHPAARAPRTLAAHIQDAGVGISWTGLTMLLDGHPVIAEWDPEAGRLTGFLRSPLEPGEYVVSVQAADRVGNKVTESLAFTVH